MTMRQIKSILLLIIGGILSAIAMAQNVSPDSQHPSLREMENFCQVTLKRLQSLFAKANNNKLAANAISMRFFIEEQQDLSRVASQLVKKPNALEQLIDSGCFQQALQYQKMRKIDHYAGVEDPCYYLHLAFLCRWLNKEEQHRQSHRTAKRCLRELQQRKQHRYLQIYRAAKELQKKYNRRYMLHKRFYPQMQKYQQQVASNPKSIEAWTKFAKYSRRLGYRLREIVAWRVLKVLNAHDKNIVEQLAKAYRETGQLAKARSLLE